MLGDLATIGRKSAVVKLGVFQLTGFLGWVFWSVVHIYFLIGIRNRFVVALNWLWSYVTFQRGARLIGESRRVKSKKQASCNVICLVAPGAIPRVDLPSRPIEFRQDFLALGGP